MDEAWSTQRLLKSRRFTRAVAEVTRERVGEIIATLQPLFRPRSVLGGHVASSSKQSVQGADQALRRLQELYGSVASSRALNLEHGLESPIDLGEPELEISPTTYVHTINSHGCSRAVTVTNPLRWTLGYQGYRVDRLRAALSQPERSMSEIRSLVVHSLVMHVVVTSQPGLTRLLADLHFPIEASTVPDLGDIIVTSIGLALSTKLPPDHVIVESTEISGADAFEELLEPGDVSLIPNDLQARLMEIAHATDIEGA